MPFPDAPIVTTFDETGAPVLDSSSLPDAIDARAQWLLRHKPRIHWSWSDGPHTGTVGAGLAFIPTDSTTENTWIIGRPMAPSIGNASGVVKLWVRQDNWSGTYPMYAGLRARPLALLSDRPDAWEDLGTFSLGTTDGWKSSTFTVPFDTGAPLEFEVFLTTFDRGGKAARAVTTTITAYTITSDGTTFAETGWDLSQFRRITGAPDDVHSLNALLTLTDAAAAVPTLLASHSFSPAPSASNNWVCRYVVPPLLVNSDVTVYAYCRTTGGSTADLNVTLSSTDTTGGLPAATATASFTSSTFAWRTITVSAPSTGAVQYLTLWLDPAGGDTAEISDVYVVQKDRPIVGEVVDGVPGVRYLPSGRFAPGVPIIGNYGNGAYEGSPSTPFGLSADDTVQNLWTDRFASASNAVHWLASQGARRVLCADHVVPQVTFTDGYGSTDIRARTKVFPSWGTERVAVWARFTTDGLSATANSIVGMATLDGDAIGGNIRTLPRDAVSLIPHFVHHLPFGAATVAPTSSYELALVAGWQDPNQVPVTSSDTGRLEGACAFDAPPGAAANMVHVRTIRSPATSIPDNDLVTGVSDSVTVTREIDVAFMRVVVQVTHDNVEDLKITLSDGTTTVTLANVGDVSTSPGTATLAFSTEYSAAYPQDLSPASALSTFYGATSAKTWTLKVYDGVAGTTGTLDKWSLEFW